MQYCTVGRGWKKKNITLNTKWLFAALLSAPWNRLACICHLITFVLPLFLKKKFQAGVSKQHRWRRQHLPAEPCFKPSDCPRHAEYACGLWCSEKMGMNNKRYCDNAVGHSAPVLLALHLPSTCEWKRHQNKITPLCQKKKKQKKGGGTLTFLHFR